ncbi:MAG: DUF177 domain-containing protein [Deltaproteobacteria bacterium]|nr:DUF177 domain-containing protein [Deltaproteobacteria bacterium]
MRLAVAAINGQIEVTIKGNEPWLEALYRDFPLPGGTGEAALLSGVLKLRVEEAGSVHVTGHLSYAPIVSCSRCDKAIAWPLACDVDVRYLPEQINDLEREKNLSRNDLDAYFLDGDEVDLEQLITDTVELALPSRFVLADAKGERCRVCAVSVADGRVYGAADDTSQSSPFAALKGLKLKQ